MSADINKMARLCHCPHMLQYGAATLSKCLVRLQQEPPKKSELEPCQTGPEGPFGRASRAASEAVFDEALPNG
jgi:hypothetical protein